MDASFAYERELTALREENRRFVVLAERNAKRVCVRVRATGLDRSSCAARFPEDRDGWCLTCEARAILAERQKAAAK